MPDFGNILEQLHNPYSQYIHKVFIDILKNKYPENKDIISRIVPALQLKSDVEQFTKLIVALYEAGFTQAIQEQSKALEKLGISITIKPPDKPADKIFN